MEFSSTCLVGTKQNDNFDFLYFSSFSDLFWLEMNHNHISFIFWIFYYFYGIFITLRVGTKRNENFYFHYFPAFSNLIWLIMWPHWYFLIFWNFFLFFCFFFLEYSVTRWIGAKRNYNFYFHTFPAFSSLFWLKMMSQWYFLIFWIFFPFFWNFLSRLR